MTEPSKIASLRLELLLPQRITEPAALLRLLTALDAEEEFLAPKRWGSTLGVRDPYDHTAILEHVARTPSERLVLVLRRARPLEVVAQLISGSGALSSVRIELTTLAAGLDADGAARVFAAFDRIVAAVGIEFGIVDIRFVDQPPDTYLRSSGGVHPAGYIDWGPETIFARTYFGARVTALFGGVEVLAHTVDTTRMLGDTLVVDLVDAPWTAEPAVLKRAQVRVEKALLLAGILARRKGKWRTIPGPRWVPPQPLGDVR
jgi:hypothetical protein